MKSCYDRDAKGNNLVTRWDYILAAVALWGVVCLIWATIFDKGMMWKIIGFLVMVGGLLLLIGLKDWKEEWKK